MRRIFLFSSAILLVAFGAAAEISPRLAEALDLQRAMAARNPNDAKILNDLGNLYSLAGDWVEAEAAYQTSLAIDPNRAATHYNLALALQETDQLAEASAAMEAAVALAPTHARALYQLGNIYLQRQERALAIDAFARSFRAAPDLAVPSVNPQVIDNPVLTESLLHAYDRRSRATMAPRIYDRPDQVTDLLVPERDLLEEAAELADTEPEEEAESPPRRVVTPQAPMFKPPAATPEELAEKKAREAAETNPEAVFGAPKGQEASDDGWGVGSGWDETGEETDSEAQNDALQSWGDLETEAAEDRKQRIEERRLRRQQLRDAARKRANEAAGNDGDGTGDTDED